MGISAMYVRQDVTSAMQNNGIGNYDCLLKIRPEGTTTIKIFIKSVDDAGNIYYGTSSGDIVIKASDGSVLIHDTLTANWDGNLASADLTIKITEDNCSIDTSELQ